MNSKFTIVWCPTPTSYNTNRTFETEELEQFLEFETAGKERIYFNLAGQKRFAVGHSIEKIFVESDTGTQVHYQDNFLGKNHVSDVIKNLIPVKKTEVLVQKR